MRQMATLKGMSDEDKLNDIEIRNRSVFVDNRCICAYLFAADKLTTSEVGLAVLGLAVQNKADHEKHQDLLGNAIINLGGTPVKMQKEYDLSPLINKGLGNL